MTDASSDSKAALDLLTSDKDSNPFASHNPRKPSIQGLLPRHDAICTFIIANPTMSLGDVADYFCISQPWLSTCIHSPVFQAKYKELRGEEYEHMVLGLSEKLNGLAHIVTDQLIEACSKTTNIDKLEKVQKNIFKALGYGTAQTNINVNTQDNSVTVNGASSSAMQESRRILKQLHPDSLGAHINDSQQQDNHRIPKLDSPAMVETKKD